MASDIINQLFYVSLRTQDRISAFHNYFIGPAYEGLVNHHKIYCMMVHSLKKCLSYSSQYSEYQACILQVFAIQF